MKCSSNIGLTKLRDEEIWGRKRVIKGIKDRRCLLNQLLTCNLLKCLLVLWAN